MTDYSNPLSANFDDLNDLPIPSREEVYKDKPKREFPLIPAGWYEGVLTDFSTEEVTAGPAQGMRRVKTTWNIQVDGRVRKHFVDFVPSGTPVCWPPEIDKKTGQPRPGDPLMDYTIANDLRKALDLPDKPWGEVFQAAQHTAVQHRIGVRKGKNGGKDRNATYEIKAV